MRRALLVIVLILLPSLAGCSLHDALFGLFGTYHSDGYTREERERNYESSVNP